MLQRKYGLGLIAALIFIYAGSTAQAKPEQIITPLSMNAKEVFELFSPYCLTSSEGYRYLISLAAATKESGKPYRALVLLDGTALMPELLNLIVAKGIDLRHNIVIIGIGHDTKLAYDTDLRARDFTPTLTDIEADDKNRALYAKGGGAEAFHAFIEDIVLRDIKNKFNIDGDHIGIFGHSFGGLFALYNLMHHQRTFTHYYIASPSLWWGQSTFIPAKIGCEGRSVMIGKGANEGKRGKSVSLNELINRIYGNCKIVEEIYPGKNHGEAAIAALDSMIRKFSE